MTRYGHYLFGFGRVLSSGSGHDDELELRIVK